MKVLITGGAGFIGSHTARALHGRGHSVRVLDILDPQIHGPGADFDAGLREIADCQRGDVLDPEDCQKALDGIGCVFHFAARTGVGQSMYDMGDYVETNVLGTIRLLETIVKTQSPIKRFVLASSRAVYGEGLFDCPMHGTVHPGPRDPAALKSGDFEVHCPQCGGVMRAVRTPTECDARPMSVYAMTKLQQEEYGQFAARTFGLPLIVLRYFNVYGSLQSLRNPYTGVISIFFGLLREGRALSMYEQGLPIRDFVHVQDVVQANLLSLAPGLRAGDVFNVGTGHAATISDIAAALGCAMGIEPRLEDRGEFRVGDIFGCLADLSRSSAVLGYVPRVDLAAGMAEFVSWAQGQQSEARYDTTVRELRTHGLFGQVAR
jgi:dTDP-L-rhamnose 4-epimerase